MTQNKIVPIDNYLENHFKNVFFVYECSEPPHAYENFYKKSRMATFRSW